MYILAILSEKALLFLVQAADLSRRDGEGRSSLLFKHSG